MIEWLSLCIILFAVGFLYLTLWFIIRNSAKIKWEVTLKDGTSFVGRRTWRAIWREGLFERAYQVVDSQNSPFRENTIVVLGLGAILYKTIGGDLT